MTLNYHSSLCRSSTLLRSLLLGLTCLGAPALTLGCGAQSDTSNIDSTDTGNPPVVSEQKLRVEASDSGVTVAGEAGAVPARAAIEVTNVATEQSETTTAAADGSFEVELEGTLDDEYRVKVEVDGRSTNATVSSNDTPTTGFLGKTFLLDSAEGHTFVEGTTPRLSFDESEIRFSAGCNSHFGNYTICGDKLCASDIGGTEIGCDEALHQQDYWLADFFTSEPAFAYEGDTLTLDGADATLVFLDREVANPDRTLTAGIWVIDTFITGDAASNVPLQVEPTILFEEDGSFEAFDTCNTLNGNYAVDNTELTLSNVSTTDEACGDMGQTAREHIGQVMNNGTVSFEIEAARLTLMRDDLGLGATTD